MEEIEVPTEHLQEEINHHANHNRDRWIQLAALSSAILATMAAVSALLAGHHANDAMLDQIKAANQWSYYQAKGVKAAVLGSKIELLSALDKDPPDKDHEKLSEYRREQEDIMNEATELAKDSEIHFAKHSQFARAVTFYQVAIAVAAISVLTKRRRYWIVSLTFGLAGAAFLAYAFAI